MNFEKLSDIIKYYQTYQLTKYKYHYRLALLAVFDEKPLSALRRADVKNGHWSVKSRYLMPRQIKKLVFVVLQ